MAEFSRAQRALIESSGTLASLAEVIGWVADGRLQADGTIRAALRGQIASVVRCLENLREDIAEPVATDRDQLVISFARQAMGKVRS